MHKMNVYDFRILVWQRETHWLNLFFLLHLFFLQESVSKPLTFIQVDFVMINFASENLLNQYRPHFLRLFDYRKFFAKFQLNHWRVLVYAISLLFFDLVQYLWISLVIRQSIFQNEVSLPKLQIKFYFFWDSLDINYLFFFVDYYPVFEIKSQ